MAINFEPQQAYDASVAQAYGASLARQANNDFALRASAQAQQASLQNAALAQQNAHFYAQEANQQQLQNSSQNFQMAHQERGAQLQAQLAETHLSQAEDMRRQRLERQVNYVQEQAAAGSLSPQEAQDYTMQLQTGLDPLQRKAQQASILQHQWQTYQIQDQVAQHATMRAQNDTFAANALPNATVPIRNPDTGEVVGIVHPNGQGGWHQMNVPPQRPEASGAIPQQVMARFVLAADRAQASEISNAQRTGTPPPAWAANDQLREADAQRRVNEMVRRQGGSSGATRGGYEQDRGALMNDLGNLLNSASPHVAPARQPVAMPPPSATGMPQTDSTI